MFFNKKKSEELKVEFWTTVPGLSKIKQVTPKKQSSSLPEWWRNAPYYSQSIRQCPSFPQMFSTSYVMPMWCDTEFTRDGDIYQWKTSDWQFSWSFHDNDQFLDHAPDHIKNKFSIVAKAISPWRVKTPKGYSLYQMPAEWHFNEKFTVPSGIVDTDSLNEINHQMFLSLEDGESFLLARGTPIAVYFPFKREDFTLEVREQTEEDAINANASKLMHSTKFLNSYRNYQKFMKGE